MEAILGQIKEVSEEIVAMRRVQKLIGQLADVYNRDLNEKMNELRAKFRVGRESTKPTRVLIYRDYIYDFVKTVQGVEKCYIIQFEGRIIIKAFINKSLKRNPIFRQEILLEIKQQIDKWKPATLDFEILVK